MNLTPPPEQNQTDISPEHFAVISAAVATMTNNPSEEILSVIAAAVATVFKDTKKVLHFKPRNYTWNHLGRMEILLSHNIHK